MTQTVWIGKELLAKPLKDLVKSFGKRSLEQTDIQRREAFQFGTKRPLKSLSKAKENTGHEQMEKAFCDLTWILTNLDTLWFKRILDILWFKNLGLSPSRIEASSWD